GRVRPDDRPAGHDVVRFENVGTADFFVSFRREPGDDEVALFIEQDRPVPLLHQESVFPTVFAFLVAAGGLERLPDPLAGLKPQTAHLAIATDTVDIPIPDEGRRHDDVQVRRLIWPFALALPFPNQYGLCPGVMEGKEEGAIVKRGDEKKIAGLARRGNAEPGTDLEGLRPVLLAGLRVEPVNGPGLPDNEMTLAAEFIDHGRAITRL